MLDFSEMEFVVAGPGARDGIRKCFADTDGLDEADVIRAVAGCGDREIDHLGLTFASLWGRPLQLIDFQNLFCEVGKYARVVHPEAKGESGRTRIKQRFTPSSESLPQWYPPKWGITVPAGTASSSNQTPSGLSEQEGLCSLRWDEIESSGREIAAHGAATVLPKLSPDRKTCEQGTVPLLRGSVGNFDVRRQLLDVAQ